MKLNDDNEFEYSTRSHGFFVFIYTLKCSLLAAIRT